MYKPLEKTSGLIEEINRLMLNQGTPDDMALARIRRDVKSLEQVGNYADSYLISGMLAGLIGDQEELVRKFDAALKASGREGSVLRHYAIAMSNLHHFSRAAELTEEAEKKALDDIEMLREALFTYKNAINFEGGKRIVKRLEGLGKLRPEDKHALEYIETKDELLKSEGITPRELTDRIELVANNLREQGHQPKAVRESVWESEMLIQFCLDGSDELLASVEDSIISTLAALPFSNVDNLVSFGCSHIPPDEHGSTAIS